MAGKLKDIRIKEFRVQDLPDIVLDLDLDLAGEVDVGLDSIQLGVTALPPVAIGVTELPDLNLSVAVEALPVLRVESDSDLRTDSEVRTNNVLDLRISELPQIDLQLSLRPIRIHFPLNFRFCLTILGCRVLDLHSCGEAMVVTEDYLPLRTEQCEPGEKP